MDRVDSDVALLLAGEKRYNKQAFANRVVNGCFGCWTRDRNWHGVLYNGMGGSRVVGSREHALDGR